MPTYYGYDEKFSLGGELPGVPASSRDTKAAASNDAHATSVLADPRYRALNLSPYLPGLVRILH